MRSISCFFLYALLAGNTLLAQTNPAPLVNQPLIPASIAPGSGGFTLNVTGTGFAPTAELYWNGSPRVTIVNSGGGLQAIITPADIAKPGTASVTVVNPTPGGGASNVVFFPVRQSASGVGLAVTPRFTAGVVAVGDFNNDGKLDVAIGEFNNNNGSGSVSVYLGNGDGTFSLPIVTNAPFGVEVLIPADVNDDGKLDLLVSQFPNSNEESAPMVVFFGNGDGTFTQGQQFSGTPTAVGDWNGDGHIDLIMEEDNGSIYSSVYLGDGQGNFTQSQFMIGTGFEGGPAGPTAVGDFNGDGKLDVAFPGVAVALGNGDGTFQNPVYYSTEFYGNEIVAADVNNDGKLDLVTSGLSVLLGKGDGTFTSAGGVSAGGNYGVILGDFNGDGQLDAAVPSSNSVSWGLDLLLGNGNGTFQNPMFYPVTKQLVGFLTFGVGDFNGDGRIDFVFSGGIDTMLLLQNSVTLAPTALAFGNQNTGTTSPPQTVTLTNVGATTLNIQSISIIGGTNFSQSNNCGTSVAPGSACSIMVTFSPKTGGYKTAALNVAFQGLGSPQTVSMNGIGVNAASVSLTPSSLSFPTQLFGTTSLSQTATLTNTGTLAVTVSSIATTGAFSATSNCPSSLPAFQACQIQVQYKPTARGQQSGELSVTDNATHSPQHVKLSGTGTVVSLSATGISFGDQQVGTTSLGIPIKVTNVGTVPLAISQISIGGANPADFTQTNNCGLGIPAGASCTIKISFTPTATGSRSATLDITDNGGASPQSVALTGTGT
jgi:hypothetical protein